MKRWLILSAVVALISNGCSQRETESPAPVTTTPPAKHQPDTAVSAAPALPAESPAKKPKPVANRPVRTEPLANLLGQYQARTGQKDERSELISDVAAMAGQTAKPEEVAATLGKMFKMETDPALKNEILDELGSVDTPAGLAPLLSALNAGQPSEVQQAAADAAESLLRDLAFSEDPGVLQQVAPALNAQYPSSVRLAAISTLEDLENKAAIPLLQPLVNDQDPEVSKAAADAIEWLKE